MSSACTATPAVRASAGLQPQSSSSVAPDPLLTRPCTSARVGADYSPRGPLLATVASLRRRLSSATAAPPTAARGARGQGAARARGRAPVGAAAPDSYALDDLRQNGLRRIPRVARGGWHLSSFGTPASVRRKFQTWGHAGTFQVPGALGEARLERCARQCLRPDPVAAGRARRSTPPSCRADSEPAAKPVGGRVLSAGEVAAADLPPVLLRDRQAFGEFFRYVRS